MRLLIVVPLYPPAIGGAELQAQRLAGRLQSKGVRVTILTRRRPGCDVVEWEGGVRVVRALKGVPLGPLWGLTFMHSTDEWLRRLSHEWDLVHNQQVDLHSLASVRVAAELGKPCLLRFASTGSGGDLSRLSQRRFGSRFVRRLEPASRFVALTEGGASEIARYGMPCSRITTIPNGVDLTGFNVRPWNGLGVHDPLRLLFVGRLGREKGLDILLAALANMSDRSQFRLRVIGSGPEENGLRDQVLRAGLGSVVEFVGNRRDVAAEYEWSELVVVPSRFEGMPNVVLEALACGRPVLGTRIVGTADLVTHGLTGWLVDPEDVDGMTVTLLELRRRRTDLRSAGLEGRRTVERNHSLDRVAAMYVNEYQTLLSGSERR